jgi:hypothetical protein
MFSYLRSLGEKKKIRLGNDHFKTKQKIKMELKISIFFILFVVELLVELCIGKIEPSYVRLQVKAVK